MITVPCRSMFKVSLLALLLQIASYTITCIEVLPNNTSYNSAGNDFNNISLPDSNNNSITSQRHEGDIAHDVRCKHYTS